MAMSNLASQLAGLNSGGASHNKNVGSILASSARHDDAVGRGMQHSVQVGHAISHQTDPRFKPSILYEDARAASDVPLSTLWENCESSLLELASFYPPLKAYARVVQETLLQRTKHTRTSLTQLLTILGTLIPHDSADCLHVLEYLVRRYNIHVSAADHLLMVLLPHAEAHPRLFHRVLQLVDVAGSQQHTWIWLRPYARTNRDGKAEVVAVPPRHVMVKHTINNTALLQQVCSMTQNVAKLATIGNSVKPHLGIQQVLSWSATLMVQGLHHLQTIPGANRESVLRVLLPVCTTACSSTGRFVDWTVWGHVVASSLSETLELAPPVKECLCRAILKPVVDKDESALSIETTADALVAVLAVCLPAGGAAAKTTTWEDATKENWKECVAVPFSSVLQQVWSLGEEVLAAALHYAYHEREIDVGGLVTSLVVDTVLHAKQTAQPVVAALMKDNAMWKNEAWISPVAEWIVWTFVREGEAEDDDDNSKKKTALYQQLLSALRGIDATACEEGMANGMVEAEENNDKKRLATLLQGVLPAAASKKELSDGKPLNTNAWLPPQVALEHADATVRTRAVRRLLKEFRANSNKDEDDDGDAVMGDNDDRLESLQEALSRRMVSDEDPNVVLAAANALKEILEKAGNQQPNLSEVVLETLYQWTSFASAKKKKKNKEKRKRKKDTKKKPAQESIIVACLAILPNTTHEKDMPVLEALTAHLGHSCEEIATTAASSLIQIMGKEETDESSSVVDEAKDLLVVQGAEFCANLLRESANDANAYDSRKATEAALRRHCLWVLMGAMKTWLSSEEEKEEMVTRRISGSVVVFCVAVLNSPAAKELEHNPKHVEALTEAWGIAAKNVAPGAIPKLVGSLASLPVESVYLSLGKDLIETLVANVKDAKGEPVSMFSVLFEAALLDTLPVASVTRLLVLAHYKLGEASGNDAAESATWYCLVPALAFLEHEDESVRLSAIKLLAAWKDSVKNQGKDAPYRPLASVCKEISKKQSSATLGGLTFLPSCLAAAVKSTGGIVRDNLLSLCLTAAVSCGSKGAADQQEIMESAWLPFGQNSGHVGAAVAVLRAMEHAGEAAFPLAHRWERFGSPILQKLLGADAVQPSLHLLCDATVGMLKGIAVADSSSLDTIVISMGPSTTGRRQRSYSIGKAEGVTYVESYPEEMVTAIAKILKYSQVEENKMAQVLCASVAKKLLGKEAWGASVFAKFSTVQKITIAGDFLRILADAPLQIPSFLKLPLYAQDIASLRKEFSEETDELAAVSILADFIRSNNTNLAASSGASLLLKTLFSALATFSSSTRHDSDEAEFVRQAILSALADLMSPDQTEQKSQQKKQISEKEVSGFVDLLLSLNSNERDTKDNIRPLLAQRAKATSLIVLTKLCASFPKPVVASLIPALQAHIAATESVESEENMIEHTTSTFGAIVPVFWKYASHSNLSFAHLLRACVESIRQITTQRKRLGIYCSLIRAVSTCPSGVDEPAMGAVVASYLACEVRTAGTKFEENLQESTEFSLQVMYESSGFAQVSSILLMLHYADSLLFKLGDSQAAQSSATSFDAKISIFPTADDLLQIALTGTAAAKASEKSKTAKDKKQVAAIKGLVQSLLLVVNDAMHMDSVRKCIRRSDRSHNALAVRLWQDLLILQSTTAGTASAVREDNVFAEMITRVSGESLEQVQKLLPLPIFLASATLLIKDGDTDDIRGGAIRLVADRATEARPGTPEASLFLEMVSLLVRFLKSAEAQTNEDVSSLEVQQSALVAIEHIARALHGGSGTEKAPKKQGRTFLSALQGCADLFVTICGPGKTMKAEMSDLDDSSKKLLCSVALCTATLVRATAPKCLALLPRFMHQLISSLCSVNTLVLSTEGVNAPEILSDARMIQVCLLRALTSVADTVPQFIFPYLKHLLANSALPSEALRGENVEQTVRLAAEGLEQSLSKHVPVRVLLPVVSTAISTLERPTEFEVLIRVLKQSIDASSGEELVGHLGALLKAVTTTYDFDCGDKVRFGLVDAANEAVVALVMKLSENHLRRLYSNLREWRGGLDTEDPDKFAMRRYAFWRVSAALSSELRAIFLPCFSTVLADALDELNFVVDDFCAAKKSEKTSGGKKKRRLDSAGVALTPQSMLSVQPLLSCLELSLRADAQGGGQWVRADDGQRYRSLLEPLGLLLQSKVPDDFPCADERSSSFQIFVQGGTSAVAGSGSVVGCMTALASAAGNEQLWKPLNYAVLDACGNRGRSEVRKAGLGCLLSLMKSLGEEYMVLLPECLPVLAEMLEDEDETVAGLAQDCISFGEDLLGESLEDSLR